MDNLKFLTFALLVPPNQRTKLHRLSYGTSSEKNFNAYFSATT